MNENGWPHAFFFFYESYWPLENLRKKGNIV